MPLNSVREKMENRRSKKVKRTITLVKEGFPFKFYLDKSCKHWGHKRILALFPKNKRIEVRRLCIEQVSKNITLVNLAESLIAQPIEKSFLNPNLEPKLPYQSSNYVSRRVIIEDTHDRVINFINNVVSNLEQNKSSVIFYEKYQCPIYLGNNYHTDIIHKYNEKVYIEQKRFSMTFNFSVLEVVSLMLDNEGKLLLVHETIVPEVFTNQSHCIQEVNTHPCTISFKKLKQNLYMIVNQED